MIRTPILLGDSAKASDGAPIWLARAAQARRIALMLAARDAAILESYALECEALAAPVPRPRPIAA